MPSPAATVTLPIDPKAYGLVRRVAVGDGRAFETLHEQYTPRLMGYLLPRLDHSYLAEEVCQDVWMVVWTQAEQLQPHCRFTTWLFGIAQRLVWKARARRINAVSETLPMPEGEAEVESPESMLAGQHHERQMALAIAALPPLLRQTITLRYHHDRTYQQIATQMGCSPDTVKVRLQQAKRRLGAQLRQIERPWPWPCDGAHMIGVTAIFPHDAARQYSLVDNRRSVQMAAVDRLRSCYST